jgi:hypothetical protein
MPPSPVARRPRRGRAIGAAAAAAALFLTPAARGQASRPAADAPAAAALAAPPGPAAAGGEKVGRLPHVEIDREKRQVRVECEALAVNAPLEFFVCLSGTAEHEAVLRSPAKPSHIHTALLMLGLKRGRPVTFLEASKKWLPPQGPPLHVTVEYQKGGQTVSYPAYRWIRDIKTKKEPRAFTWIFAGSRDTPDGRYGADDTGYTATLVNFDYALIDIPDLASNSNEQLEWERNADLMPPKGTKVWLVIEPVGAPEATPGTGATPAGGAAAAGGAATPGLPAFPAATTQPAAPAATAPAGLSDVEIDERRVQSMVDYHQKVMGPRQQALREATEAHYKVIGELRKEQQRLITEADRIQRAIDQLEKSWNDAVTPRPESDLPPQPEPPAGPPPAGN